MNNPVATLIISELRRKRMYLVWWSLGIVTLVALTVMAYGSIKDQAAQLDKAFGSLSSSIGGFVGTSDMFSPVGYLNSQLYYITLPILFIILSVTLAGSLINKEERHHTLELLLARPISRTQLLVAKALTGVGIILILGAVTALATIICGLLVGLSVSAVHIALATLFMMLFASAFGAVAYMLYAAHRLTRRLAVPAAILFSFGGYILSSLGGMVHGLSGIAKAFPYHYYNPGDILNGKVEAGLIVYLTAIYIVSIAVAILGFRRRDLS